MNLRHLVDLRGDPARGQLCPGRPCPGLLQPTVTLHVQELEKALGLPLFHRRGRQETLSDAGAALATRCRPVLEGLDTLKRTMAELRAGTGGELRIGCIEPAASRRLVPMLAAFCRARPGLRVRLEVGGTATVSGQVAAGRLDLGLCSLPSPELPLRFEPLFTERMALLLPAGHPLARGRRVRVRDLQGQRLLLTEQGCAYRRTIEKALREAGAEVECRMEIGSLAGLIGGVQSGLGIAILPVLAARPAPSRTVLRDLVDLDLALPVGLVRREHGVPTLPWWARS